MSKRQADEVVYNLILTTIPNKQTIMMTIITSGYISVTRTTIERVPM